MTRVSITAEGFGGISRNKSEPCSCDKHVAFAARSGPRRLMTNPELDQVTHHFKGQCYGVTLIGGIAAGVLGAHWIGWSGKRQTSAVPGGRNGRQPTEARCDMS